MRPSDHDDGPDWSWILHTLHAVLGLLIVLLVLRRIASLEQKVGFKYQSDQHVQVAPDHNQ